MIDPKVTKEDAGKYIKRKKRGAFRAGVEANKQVDIHFINRLQNLAHSWRFVLSWLLLASLLVWVLAIQTRSLRTYYTQIVPQEGGTYVEGIIGPLTNMNPIYATTSADQAVSRLLFSGLMKYDADNQLIGDLAESIESDDKASVFTVKLKPDLTWHDGTPLTSQDIAYTVRTIQDPDAKSPLFRSWEGVRVEAIDSQTISFTLPGSFSPFPHLLTFGVLPRHLLLDYTSSQLRSVTFNSSEPIGSGPFEFQRIVNVNESGSENNEIKVQLTAYENYHQGRPKLDAFTFWVADSEDRLTDIFNEGQLNGAAQIIDQEIEREELGVSESVFGQTSGVYMFYKTTSTQLSDVKMRSALTKILDIKLVLGALERPVQRIYGPLLPGQLGYRAGITQTATDIEAGQTELTGLGWQTEADGFRYKNGEKLTLTITTQKDTEYQLIADEIVRQLREQGVDARLDLRDLSGFAENVLLNHVYSDILVYGINLGADPDVYSFWHSSQADKNSTVRLNLSEYSSDEADEALEGGRSRVEPDVREVKYQTFVDQWIKDVPAVALYRPQLIYYNLRNVRGPEGGILRNQIDRYRDVDMWTVLTERIEYQEGQESLR